MTNADVRRRLYSDSQSPVATSAGSAKRALPSDHCSSRSAATGRFSFGPVIISRLPGARCCNNAHAARKSTRETGHGWHGAARRRCCPLRAERTSPRMARPARRRRSRRCCQRASTKDYPQVLTTRRARHKIAMRSLIARVPVCQTHSLRPVLPSTGPVRVLSSDPSPDLTSR